LEINGGSGSSTYNENTLYSSLNASFQDWMADSSRKAGDVAYFPSTSGDTVSGYYVVMFQDSNDNNFAMKNVRHILVAPSHDHAEDETHEDGETYSAEELAAAKAAADEILASWKAGEATEESFALLANEKSADGDGVSGGLYENIYPGQMVEAFENWCYDAARKTGDTDIVETEYGYHVMYFVGDSEMSYRDYQIENALRSNALNEWYTEAVAAMAQTEGSTQYIRKDLVLNAA
ncbi:MAG: peptidylprolyl isomerase, partial [Oscillospiraceae bacterium]|nr:peptidylprolyl isomerase [Oscillospiraceae bacterium]